MQSFRKIVVQISAIICLMLLLFISPPAHVESLGGVEYGLNNQLPVGFTSFVQSGNFITYNGTGMFVNASSNTYAYIATQINDSVSYIETNITQISGDSGVSWGPGVGNYWNNNTKVYFAASEIGSGGKLFVYSRINDIFSESYVPVHLDYNESIYLRIFIVENHYLKFEFSKDATVWTDFVKNSNILQGNNTDTIDLSKQNIDSSNVTVMIGKGFLPFYNQFVNHESGPFSSYYNQGLGANGVSYYDYLKFNNTMYFYPNHTVTSTDNHTETSTTTTTDSELIFQNNTVTVTETFNNTNNPNPTLDSPFTPLSIISCSVVLIAITRYRKY